MTEVMGGTSAGRRSIRAYLNGEPWFPMLVIAGLFWADQVDTKSFQVLGPDIAKAFHVNDGVFNLIAGLVAIVGPLIGIPLSRIAERRNRVPLAIGGAVVWSVFSVLTGLAPVLWFLIAARVISTSGEIVNTPVHSALISDYYSPKTRAKGFGIYQMIGVAGGALGGVLSGVLNDAFGWRLPFIVLAVPTGVVLFFALKLTEPTRGQHERLDAAPAKGFRDAARTLWALRSLRLQWIGTAFAAASLLLVNNYAPFFMKTVFHIGSTGRGVIQGVGTVITLPAFIVGASVLQRRMNVSPSKAMKLLAQLGGASALALFGLSVAPNSVFLVIDIYVIYALFAVIGAAVYALPSIIAGPELRTTAFGLQGGLAVAGIIPALPGFIIEGTHHPRIAVFYMGALFGFGIVFFFRAVRFIDSDVARLDPAFRARAREVAAGEAPVLLETSGVTVSYSGVQVLFGVDIEVREGETVALLGTNGAGKSTILNAISGVVEPDGGNVFFQGEPITGEPPERTVARGIVQVPGGRGVFPRLSVEENLAMGAFLIRKDRALVRQRMEEVLALFPRLEERLTQKAGLLSGGERQMLTLASSFLLKPKLLLIDELSLGLAPTVVQELLEAVRGINAAGTSVVLVEQSVNVALTMADRAYFMEKGEVRFSGPTSELLERGDLLRSVFLEGAAAGVGS